MPIKLNYFSRIEENYPEKIISNEKEISETFNHYFIDIANNLGLHQNSEMLNNTDHLNDLSEKAVEKFKDHPSIIEIKKNRLLQSSFSFQKVSKKRSFRCFKILPKRRYPE